MSETSKKKPDFNTLDFSNITGGAQLQAAAEVPPPVQGPDMTKKVEEGTWIEGVPVKEVTPEEFHQWLVKILPPGSGVENWELSIMDTPAQREKLVLRVADLFYRGFSSLRTVPDKNKNKYVN